MLTSEFTQLAQLPPNWREEHLQNYIAETLKARGFQVTTELGLNHGRADIVTNWNNGSIIEVKKFLDRDTIYQATGQLHVYGLNNNRKLVVMGLMTTDNKSQQSAINTARIVSQNPRISVIFLNQSEEWHPRRSGNNRFKMNGLANIFKLPTFSLPSIRESWLLDLLKSNPLIIVLAIAVLIGISQSLVAITPNSSHPYAHQKQAKAKTRSTNRAIRSIRNKQ